MSEKRPKYRGEFEIWGTDACANEDHCDGRITLFVSNKKCILCDPESYRKKEVLPAEISREAMFEAAAECWKQSQSWEQGMEGPAATDRGSLKHGFLQGVRWTMERLK
jgi:hypothetical protein